MGVKTENGNNVFYGFPKTATSPGQTFSSFALSTQKFSDMTLELDMKTYKQYDRTVPLIHGNPHG